MAVEVKHSTVATAADQAGKEINKGEWNAAHNFNLTGPALLGRGSAGVGAAVEITLGTNLSFSGTTLNATGSGGASAINDLTDVTISSPSSGQVLKFNGTVWVNDTDATGAGGGSVAGDIDGMMLSYVDADSFNVSSGTIDINGTLRTHAGGDVNSGTALDLSGATVTFGAGATKAYYVFAYWNGSALSIRLEEIDGTGDGATPVWDTSLRYWKAATTGANARRIGKIYVDNSGNIIKFLAAGRGRSREYLTTDSAQITLVSATASAGWTELTNEQPFTSPDDTHVIFGLSVNRAAAAGTGIVVGRLSTDGGTTYPINLVFDNVTQGNGATLGVATPMPYAANWHFSTTSTSATMSIRVRGFKFEA